MIETQGEPRFRKRIPCRLQLGESSYAGVMLNFSRTGLFVQTSATPSPGDTVELRMQGGMQLEAEAIWQRRVPPQLRSVSEGGVGLRIRNAPETYYAMLAEAAGVTGVTAQPASVPPAAARAARSAPSKPSSAKRPRGAAEPGQLYRVRVKRRDGPRSRTLEVRAGSETHARVRALTEAGEGWLVAELERVR